MKITTGMYNPKNHSSGRIRKIIFKTKTDHERVAKLIKVNTKLLDYGCGNCFFFDTLNRGVEKIGFEIDERYIQIGKSKGYTVVNKLNGLKDFDYITSNQVVEHMNLSQLNRFFENSNKLLKKNGKLIVSTLNGNELYSLKNIWDDPTHVRPYTVTSLKRAGEQYGFVIEKVIKHHMRINPIKFLSNLALGFSVYSGITVVYRKL